jgi:uncharacterized MAPEG superfamily protein
MTALFWVPYVLERMVALGVLGAMRPVDPEDEAKQSLWARRAKRAHYNGVENLAVFATLVLVAFAMGKGDEHDILVASQVYFWARLVHFPAGAFGLTGWARKGLLFPVDEPDRVMPLAAPRSLP